MSLFKNYFYYKWLRMKNRQLPEIRRCSLIRIKPLPANDLAGYIMAENITSRADPFFNPTICLQNLGDKRRAHLASLIVSDRQRVNRRCGN